MEDVPLLILAKLQKKLQIWIYSFEEIMENNCKIG